jgi:hypothetical protein
MLVVRKELSDTQSPPLYEFVIDGPIGLFYKAAALERNQCFMAAARTVSVMVFF